MIWDKEKKFDFDKTNKEAFEILDAHFKKFTETGSNILNEIENPQWIIDAMEEYKTKQK